MKQNCPEHREVPCKCIVREVINERPTGLAGYKAEEGNMGYCNKHEINYKVRCFQCHQDELMDKNPKKYVAALTCRYCGKGRYHKHDDDCMTQVSI